MTAFGGEETLTELVQLLFLNGAAQVKAVPVAEEAGYKAAFSVLEAAEDIAVVVCDSGELTVQQALRDSVKAASEARRERIAVVGGKAGENATALVQRAEGLNSERVVLTAPVGEGGGAAVAALAVYSHTASLFGDGLARSMVSIAESKAALGFGDAFLRGVLCNFLVCLAVWMAAASKRAEGKVIALFFPILLFVLCGYEHCIANLYYLPAGAFAAAEYGMETTLTLAGCLKNLAAVTLGNLVGGAALGVGYRFAYLKE